MATSSFFTDLVISKEDEKKFMRMISKKPIKRTVVKTSSLTSANDLTKQFARRNND